MLRCRCSLHIRRLACSSVIIIIMLYYCYYYYLRHLSDTRSYHCGVNVRDNTRRQWTDWYITSVHWTTGDRSHHHSGRPRSLPSSSCVLLQELVHRPRVRMIVTISCADKTSSKLPCTLLAYAVFHKKDPLYFRL